MYDFAAAKKSQLVEIVRVAQETQNCPVSAFSTLMRLKPDELVEKIGVICGDEYEVADDGSVVPVAQNGADHDEPGIVEKIQEAVEDMVGWVFQKKDPEVVVAEIEAEAAEKVEEKAEGRKRGAKPHHGDDEIITVVGSSSYRDGSGRAEYFGKFRSGMTVGEYVETAGPKARRTIRKSLAKGLIQLSKPSTPEG